MKHILTVLLFVIGIAHAAPGSPHETDFLTAPRTKHFLELCSGISIHDITTNSFAYGVCMGFTRGFVEGHQLTVELTTRANRDLQPPKTQETMARLWCVPSRTTNDALMQPVLRWINQYPQEYDALVKQFNGVNAATAVIIKSINKGFGC